MGGGGRPNQKFLLKAEKLSLMLGYEAKQELIFWGFEDERWGGGRQQSENCLVKLKNERLLFCEHP